LKYKMLAVGIVFLFIITSVTPMVIGYTSYDVSSGSDEFLEKLAHANYDGYISSDSKEYNDPLLNERFADETTTSSKSLQTGLSDGPMDSPWPMKCHDTHHTGLSPYSTADNPDGVEKWRFRCDWNRGGVIDFYLYAINPNGSLKWRYRTDMWIWSSPAIAEDGTVYVTSYDHYLHAVNPDGTQKWRFLAGHPISTSPAIAEDGTIYFGDSARRIFAVNPNGTEKWHYDAGSDIYSDPAIADDGTIYVGSWDNYFYALYPNGTLRWRFHTGNHIKGPASIDDDGTIYFGSWDGYLYALHSNGTMKWQSSVGSGTETNPSIANDGTIYVGGDALYAVYPNNGTRKWTFNLGSNRHIHQSSPAISSDGTIYVGVNVGDRGAEILSVNPDGTEKWRKWVGDLEAQSSPCIGEDGTVYVASSSMTQTGGDYGYLHAFGRGELIADAGGPYNALINEDIQFSSTIWGGIPPYEYIWDFGDGDTSVDDNPVHSYPVQGNYSVTLTVTDAEDNVSVDTTMAYVRSPPSTPDIDGPASGHFGEEYDYYRC